MVIQYWIYSKAKRRCSLVVVNCTKPLDTYIFRKSSIVVLSASILKVPTNTGRTTVIESDQAFIRRPHNESIDPYSAVLKSREETR